MIDRQNNLQYIFVVIFIVALSITPDSSIAEIPDGYETIAPKDDFCGRYTHRSRSKEWSFTFNSDGRGVFYYASGDVNNFSWYVKMDEDNGKPQVFTGKDNKSGYAYQVLMYKDKPDPTGYNKSRMDIIWVDTQWPKALIGNTIYEQESTAGSEKLNQGACRTKP